MEFLSQATLAAAAVVTLVVQILKAKIIPVSFANKYPVPTNIILSLVAAFVLSPFDWQSTDIKQILLQAGAIAVTAAIAYNQLLSKWPQLKETEGV